MLGIVFAKVYFYARAPTVERMAMWQRIQDEIARIFSEQFGALAPKKPFFWSFLCSWLGCAAFSFVGVLLNVAFLSELLKDYWIYVKEAPFVAGGVILAWSAVWAVILVSSMRKGTYFSPHFPDDLVIWRPSARILV